MEDKKGGRDRSKRAVCLAGVCNSTGRRGGGGSAGKDALEEDQVLGGRG